jgi:RHS repeat-associated protein
LADANLYRFSSKELHANAGLVYYLYRFYEPGLQRWLNRDRIGLRGGLNVYQGFRNAPTIWVDHFGLDDIYWPVPSPLPYQPDQDVQEAKVWLAKCHPELCGPNKPVVNLPGLGGLTGSFGQSFPLLPIIIIDVPAHKGDIGELVNTLAHECMHNQVGALIALIDYYFNDQGFNDNMESDADMIGREYDRDPEGKNCQCSGQHAGAPSPPADMRYYFP